MNQFLTVAIVDDDSGVRTSLSSLLRALGHVVRTYVSAREFIADASASASAPDLLLSDIQMPGMSGEQLQAALIATGRTVPTIFMTAFPDEAVRRRLLAAGARACLDKPIDADTLSRHLGAIRPHPD